MTIDGIDYFEEKKWDEGAQRINEEVQACLGLTTIRHVTKIVGAPQAKGV